MKKTSAKLKTPARVGNQTLKKSVSIKPPKKLKRASVAKKASKGNEARKPRLKAKENLRTLVILISAVGDNFLRPEDSRKNLIAIYRNKLMAEQKLALQKRWGVKTDEAHKAVESGWLALKREILNTVCGGKFGGDNSAREKWIINFLKDEPTRLIEAYLDDPVLAQAATRRGKDFFSYIGQIADLKTGRNRLFTSHLNGLKKYAKWFILTYWCECPTSDFPPLCLWTDSSIHAILGDEENPMSFDTIRKTKERFQLFSPTRRYRFVYRKAGKGDFILYRD